MGRAGVFERIDSMIEARRLHILRAVADHRTVTAAAAALSSATGAMCV
ncbi:hypothetical protein SHIRM173S_06287 [Streptomyces hirsutus]